MDISYFFLHFLSFSLSRFRQSCRRNEVLLCLFFLVHFNLCTSLSFYLDLFIHIWLYFISRVRNLPIETCNNIYLELFLLIFLSLSFSLFLLISLFVSTWLRFASKVKCFPIEIGHRSTEVVVVVEVVLPEVKILKRKRQCLLNDYF